MPNHNPLTADEVREMEKRCELAMPGPWRYRAHNGRVWAIEGPDGTEALSAFDNETLNIDGRTLIFITESRTDMERLIADWWRLTKFKELWDTVLKEEPWNMIACGMEDFEWRCAFCGCEKPYHSDTCPYEAARRTPSPEAT